MISRARTLALATACAFWAGSAGAQTPAPGQPAPSGQTPQPTTGSAPAATRPATTTFYGDTGLWFVPTAEVLAHGKWSVTGYRREARSQAAAVAAVAAGAADCAVCSREAAERAGLGFVPLAEQMIALVAGPGLEPDERVSRLHRALFDP